MVDNADDVILMQKIRYHLHHDENMNQHQLKHEKKEICDQANSETNSNHDCCTMLINEGVDIAVIFFSPASYARHYSNYHKYVSVLH